MIFSCVLFRRLFFSIPTTNSNTFSFTFSFLMSELELNIKIFLEINKYLHAIRGERGEEEQRKPQSKTNTTYCKTHFSNTIINFKYFLFTSIILLPDFCFILNISFFFDGVSLVSFHFISRL